MASKPATTTKKAAAPTAAAKKPGKPALAAKGSEKPVPAPAKKLTSKAAVPKKPAETVTLKTVFERLAEAQDMPKKQALAMATGMVELVTSILKNGDRVRLSGLGIIEVKDRPARMGRNPATGAAIPIAASRKVAFRVAKELKTAV
jgi:DNA-binding protein HU-beta